ncbi:hypothetical protein [Paenibacillus sp. Root52]|uniref:hypothetical protein n=1 Tax=Paenibacillus sp. Root52 TaxID=1736552 RepID=UPI000A569EBF|nr:hypothetical protein [Paenibacillus sp. Root52]
MTSRGFSMLWQYSITPGVLKNCGHANTPFGRKNQIYSVVIGDITVLGFVSIPIRRDTVE